MKAQRLPFRIYPTTDQAELTEIAALRAEAYGRRLPGLARLLAEPEPDDAAEGNAVLAVRASPGGNCGCTTPSGQDGWTPQACQPGRLLGSLRLHTNLHRSLPVEGSVPFPDRLRTALLVEVTRLAVAPKADRLVKLALFKASYLFGLANGIDHLVAAGRAEVYRQYAEMLFDEVAPGTGLVPLRHAGGLGHMVMHLPVAGARARWTAVQHPWLEFMVDTEHPDIGVPVLAQPAPTAPSL